MKNYKLSLIAARNFLQYCQDHRIYAFLGRTNTWGSPDIAPSGIQESTYNLVNDFNETILAKKILDSNFSLVIRRINWEERKFDQWDDSDPLIAEKDFYCLTSSNHVYKCVSNNQDSISTVEPSAISTTPFQTADGYVWKYLFSVNLDDQLKFLTPNWIPVKEISSSQVGYENQYASQIAAVPGTIDRIDLIQNGSNYGPNTTVTIEGDGIGATASLTIENGLITKITVTNPGQGYTWAKVTITDPQSVPGTGAIAKAVLSPILGHGHNPAEELYASHVIASCTIEGFEGGLIRGDITYRKVLLVADPQLLDGTFATDYRYDNTTKVTLTNTSGTFSIGEKISFTDGQGYVVYTEPNTLYLTALDGTPSGIVTGETSAATGTVESVTDRAFKVSGSTFFKSYFDPRTKLLEDNIEIKPLFSF